MNAFIDTHKVIKKLEAVNFSESQAETIVDVLSNIDDQLATKNDLVHLKFELHKDMDLMKKDLVIYMYSGMIALGGVILAAIAYL